MQAHRNHSQSFVSVLTLAGLMSVSAPALAQDTRAEAIAQEKARKAQHLEPYKPGTVERIYTRVSNSVLIAPSGLYPALGSVYSGGGFAAGPGLRIGTGGSSYFDARAMYSIRQYKLAEAAFAAPELAGNRLALRLNGGWMDATQIGFFGTGMDTSNDNRANFRLKEAFAGADVTLRPAGPLRFGAGAAYEDYTTERGLGRHPSIEDVVFNTAIPGLGSSPAYTHLTASAGIDSRPAPAYARRGTLLNVRYHAYRDQDTTFSFNRVDTEAIQHLPILRENWVLSVRGRLQSTVGDDDQVPYFLLPALGSGSTLRAYSTGRFRDRHALLLQAEWRWIPNKHGLDMALFYDAGMVASRRRDLDLKGMRTDVGIGARFHGPKHTALRMELARGREGLHFVFATGAAF